MNTLPSLFRPVLWAFLFVFTVTAPGVAVSGESLQQAMGFALANSQELQAHSAEFRLKARRFDWSSSLSFGYTINNPNRETNPEVESWRSGLSLNVPLGRGARKRDAATAEREYEVKSQTLRREFLANIHSLRMTLNSCIVAFESAERLQRRLGQNRALLAQSNGDMNSLWGQEDAVQRALSKYNSEQRRVLSQFETMVVKWVAPDKQPELDGLLRRYFGKRCLNS